LSDLAISSLSKVYVHVPVRDAIDGADPTADTVEMAFTASGNPTSGDWKAATWHTDASDPARPVHYARCLVGPAGTVTLAPGTYRIWVRVTDTPEVPVLESSRLVVS